MTKHCYLLFRIDAEHAGEFILERNGINCPIPVLNIHGNDKSLEKIYSQDDDGNCNNNGTYNIM